MTEIMVKASLLDGALKKIAVLEARVEADRMVIEDRSMNGEDIICASDAYWYIGTELLNVPDGGSVCGTVQHMVDTLKTIQEIIVVRDTDAEITELVDEALYP